MLPDRGPRTGQGTEAGTGPTFVLAAGGTPSRESRKAAQGKYGWHEAQATTSTRSGWTANVSGGQGRPERPIARPQVGTGVRQQFDRQHEEEGGVGRMPEDADEVVAPGFQPPDGELGRVEEPGQRLIDPQQGGPPCPAKLGPAEPAEMRVLEEVRPVIPGRDEAILQRGDERERRQQAEGATIAARRMRPPPRAVPAAGRGVVDPGGRRAASQAAPPPCELLPVSRSITTPLCSFGATQTGRMSVKGGPHCPTGSSTRVIPATAGRGPSYADSYRRRRRSPTRWPGTGRTSARLYG